MLLKIFSSILLVSGIDFPGENNTNILKFYLNKPGIYIDTSISVYGYDT